MLIRRDAIVAALEAGLAVRFLALGESMLPTIEGGSSVFVVPCKAPVDVGAIVLARTSHAGLVLHRVVECSGVGPEWKGLLKGDALKTPDGWVTRQEVLGVLVERG